MGRDRGSILDRFPADGTVLIGNEELTTPYRVEDGAMLLIAGTCDGGAASVVTEPLGLDPVRTDDGRAVAALWIADFTTANLGPHGELQLSIFAEQHCGDVVSAGPWAFYEAVTRASAPWMVCHRLWNTTPRVVRYNDEHLGLAVELAGGGLRRDGAAWAFDFTDPQGQRLAEGIIDLPRRTSPGDAWRLSRAIGLRAASALARETPSVSVVSPRLGESGALRVAATHTQAGRAVLRNWNAQDHLALRDPALEGLAFAPTMVAAFTEVRFVYLRPDELPRL
jgi:hypothetical protein